MGRKLVAVPLLWGAWIAWIEAYRWAENWWGRCAPLGVSWVPILHNVARVEAYLHTKWHLHPSSRLATIDIGRKLGALPPSWGEELGPHLTQCGQGGGLPVCQV